MLAAIHSQDGGNTAATAATSAVATAAAATTTTTTTTTEASPSTSAQPTSDAPHRDVAISRVRKSLFKRQACHIPQKNKNRLCSKGLWWVLASFWWFNKVRKFESWSSFARRAKEHFNFIIIEVKMKEYGKSWSNVTVNSISKMALKVQIIERKNSKRI